MNTRRILVLACTFLMAVVPAFAQGSGSTKPPSGSRERPHSVTRVAEGRVAEIDTAHRAIAVETGDGRRTFSIDDDTKFTGRDGASFAELADGDRVRVRYRTSGDVAVEIRVYPR